jgi:hypothetical protein
VIFVMDGAMLQRPPNGDSPVVPVAEAQPDAGPGRDSPDSRLVELVRLLARRAARQWHEKMMEERRAGRS